MAARTKKKFDYFGRPDLKVSFKVGKALDEANAIAYQLALSYARPKKGYDEPMVPLTLPTASEARRKIAALGNTLAIVFTPEGEKSMRTHLQNWRHTTDAWREKVPGRTVVQAFDVLGHLATLYGELAVAPFYGAIEVEKKAMRLATYIGDVGLHYDPYLEYYR